MDPVELPLRAALGGRHAFIRLVFEPKDQDLIAFPHLCELYRIYSLPLRKERVELSRKAFTYAVRGSSLTILRMLLPIVEGQAFFSQFYEVEEDFLFDSIKEALLLESELMISFLFDSIPSLKWSNMFTSRRFGMVGSNLKSINVYRVLFNSSSIPDTVKSTLLFILLKQTCTENATLFIEAFALVGSYLMKTYPVARELFLVACRAYNLDSVRFIVEKIGPKQDLINHHGSILTKLFVGEKDDKLVQVEKLPELYSYLVSEGFLVDDAIMFSVYSDLLAPGAMELSDKLGLLDYNNRLSLRGFLRLKQVGYLYSLGIHRKFKPLSANEISNAIELEKRLGGDMSLPDLGKVVKLAMLETLCSLSCLEFCHPPDISFKEAMQRISGHSDTLYYWKRFDEVLDRFAERGHRLNDSLLHSLLRKVITFSPGETCCLISY